MLSKWSVKHPVAAVMLILAFVVLGIISVLRLGVELYPRIDFPILSIITAYPGASPTDVEEQVTKVIEEAVSGIPGVEKVSSESAENYSNVVVELAYGTNVQESLNKVRNEIEKAKPNLPSGVQSPTVGAFNLSSLPVFSVFLYGDLPLYKITSYAKNELENDLKSVKGVASVDIIGSSEKQISVDLDPSKMKKLEITADQVAGAISLYDMSMPLGKVESKNKALNIRLAGGLDNISLIKNIIIRPNIEYDEMPSQQEIANSLRRSIQRQVSRQLAAFQQLQQQQMARLQSNPALINQNQGQNSSLQQQSMPKMKFQAPSINVKKKSLPMVKLSQVAKISEVIKTGETISRVNSKPAVQINVRKSDDANTVQVVDELKEDLTIKKNSFPPGTRYSIITDQSREINSSIGGTSKGALYAAILATIVLIVFLRSIRSTLIIALSIPTSIVSTFMIIYFSGYTLNMVTLGGLALGIGMLVDNSIVVLENIFRHMESGKDPKEASIEGSHEVAGAISASTFTTIGVFLPILFISGMAKEWLGPLAVVVISSLAFSLLVALTLIPVLTSKFYGIKNKKREETGFSALSLENIYKPIVELTLKYRYIVVVLMILAVVGTAFIARTIGAILMSGGSTQEVISINAEMPATASKTASLKVASIIEKKLIGLSGVNDITTEVGVQTGMMSQKSSSVNIRLWLEDANIRKISLSSMVDNVRKKMIRINGVKNIIVRGQDTSFGGGNQSAIQLKVAGPNLKELERLTKKLRSKIAGIKGIDSINTTIDEAKPEYFIRVNQKKAMEESVSLMSIVNLIKIAMHGQEVSKIKNDSGEETKVVMNMSKASEKIGLLKVVPIQTSDDYRKIGDYVKIKLGKTYKTIFRENKNRALFIGVDVDKEKTTISEMSNKIKNAIKDVKLPNNYEYSFGGEVEDMAVIFTQMSQAMLVAIVLIYMIMAAQFGSLKNPFIIMFTVPLAAIGVVLGLKLFSTSFSLIVFLGLITLAGIVVNNGIVLLDFVKILRERGMSVKDSLVKAGMLRIRPILMTAGTTVFGMVPVALNIGGKQMMAPMAVTIIGGLTFSTILSLIFIPALYSIMNKD